MATGVSIDVLNTPTSQIFAYIVPSQFLFYRALPRTLGAKCSFQERRQSTIFWDDN